MMIIGITTTFALLAFGDFGQTRRYKAASEELAMLIPLATDQAILEPAILGLKIDERGYGFYRFDLNKESWLALDKDQLFRYRKLPKGMLMHLRLQGTSPIPLSKAAVPIIISPTGNITPFVVDVSQSSGKVLFRIVVKFNGTVKLVEQAS